MQLIHVRANQNCYYIILNWVNIFQYLFLVLTCDTLQRKKKYGWHFQIMKSSSIVEWNFQLYNY